MRRPRYRPHAINSSISVGINDTSQFPGMVNRIMRYCAKQLACEEPLRQSNTCSVSNSVEPVNRPNMDSKPNDCLEETATSEPTACTPAAIPISLRISYKAPCLYTSP